MISVLMTDRPEQRTSTKRPSANAVLTANRRGRILAEVPVSESSTAGVSPSSALPSFDNAGVGHRSEKHRLSAETDSAPVCPFVAISFHGGSTVTLPCIA